MTMAPSSTLVVLVLLTAFIHVQGTQKNVQAEKDATITLPCDIDSAKCGDLHSIKWYRGSARIYVFSHVSNIARPEGSHTSRMEVQYVPNSIESHLQIRSLDLTDEAVYKCELTYMEVRENCDVVQFVNLTTLVKPSAVIVRDGNGTILPDGSTLGPFNERTSVELTCEAIGGKPVPLVAWYNGTKKLDAEYSQELNGTHGVGTGRARLQVVLSRGDLRARYECHVENDALAKPLVTRLDVDVHVRPTSLVLSGVESHVVKGTNVLLQCNVYGARPAANVTWYNGSEPILHEITERITPNRPITRTVEMDDGTFETQSRLIFTASRFENGQSIKCKADNAVMRAMVETPIHKTITLEVFYPPIVYVEPENITVNEGKNVSLLCQYEANPAPLVSTQWLKNGQVLSVSDKNHYEGGNNEHTALLIKNVTRDDMGEYSCVLGNSVGVQESENVAYLNVHYKPIVELVMDPPSPIIQKDQTNVTLRCNVVSGNPDTLLSVRWYMDGELLKELPECNGTAEDPLCDIDPSKMLLQTVEKEFAGNHTCEGMNAAGWGPRSEDTELVVYYPPSNTVLTFNPKRVIKKSSVTLSCSVQYPGKPENTRYRWLRGEHRVPDITTAEWTINPVTLETRSEFTCIPYNEGGDAEAATVYIPVYAPPAFISKLPPYHGALYNSKNNSISCRIECYPQCEVIWLKNNKPIDFENSDLYYVSTTNISKDFKTNDFESVHSALVWNMTAWPNEQLDRLNDNANYTCESTTNGVGSTGVKSTTYFAVEYPPENLTLSNLVVNVIENHIPEKVLCSAKSHPEPSYQWRREGSDEIIVKGNKLMIGQPVPRRDAGNYFCEAFNKHGSATRAAYLNVLYKPECQISQTVIDGNAVLVCSVKANPEEVDFIWKIKDDNDTVNEDSVESNGLQSILTLDSSVEEFRTYLCYANNSVGISFPCERDVTGAIAWWKRLSNDELLIIVAVIVALILCVIIICVIIIIVCRRKRASDKYNNPVEMEEREKPEGESPPEHGTQQTHRWPLKPGVLVHVNRMHSLSMGRLTNLSLAGLNLTNTTQPKQTPSSYSTSKSNKTPLKAGLNASKFSRNHNRRVKSMGCLVRSDDYSQHSRAYRFKQLFSKGFGGTLDDSFPEGVFKGSSGVVTFKKLPTPSPNEKMSMVSRKRKKPGQGPSQSNTADKNALNPDNASEVLTDPDRGFYENLPFHGMQNPPNKPISIISPILTQALIPNTTSIPTQTTTANKSSLPTNPFSPNNPSNIFRFNGNVQEGSTNSSISKSPTDVNLIFINKSVTTPTKSRGSFGNHRDSLQRNIDSRKYFSLATRKNKNPPPYFYSMQTCKKHNKRAAIFTVSDTMLNEIKKKAENFDKVQQLQPPLVPIKSTANDNVPQNAETRKIVTQSSVVPEKSDTIKNITSENIYENLTDSIQILEQNIVEVEKSLESGSSKPKPAPRTKISVSPINDDHLYQNLPVAVSPNNSKIQSNTFVEFDRALKAKSSGQNQPIASNIFMSSQKNALRPVAVFNSTPPVIVGGQAKTPQSTVAVNRVTPLQSTVFSPPKTISNNPKLPNLQQIQPRVANLQNSIVRPMASVQSNQNQFYTLTPNFKHLTSPDRQYNSQFSNYSTLPPNRHLKLLPKTLFSDQPTISKSKSFSNKQKNKKHFQIPLQKCHSFKYQPADSFFQPIKPSINDDLTENGHLKNPFGESHFGYYGDKPYIRKPICNNGENATSPNTNSIQMQMRKPMKMNFSNEKRKGPLLCVKNDMISREHFHENNEFVKLQYPQPLYGQNTHPFCPNGVVYADLALSDVNSCTKTSLPNDKLSTTSLEDRSNENKKTGRHKTEYATLKFNDIGQEIDV